MEEQHREVEEHHREVEEHHREVEEQSRRVEEQHRKEEHSHFPRDFHLERSQLTSHSQKARNKEKERKGNGLLRNGQHGRRSNMQRKKPRRKLQRLRQESNKR